MATTRGLSWGSFFAGAIALVLLAIVVAAIVVFGGFYDIAATTPHTAPVKALLGATMDNSVKRQASGLRAPQFTAADIREGGSHFKGMCQECHGGPGVKPEEFATAMLPDPPDLGKVAGDWSVPEIFWIAKHGIKMSAMPAFGKTDEDDELWKVAAFVKQLPKTTPAQYAALPVAPEHEGSGHAD